MLMCWRFSPVSRESILHSLIPYASVSVCKKGVSRQNMTLTSCQNAACSNEFFSLTGRLYSGGSTF